MYPKVGQTGRVPNPFPTFHDRGVGLAGLCVDEHEACADLEAFQDLEGGVIQGNRPELLGLAVGGRNAP